MPSTQHLSKLKLDVFTTPSIPFVNPPPNLPQTLTPEWSPMVSTLISGTKEAILVDAFLTRSQANSLADWIEATIPGKELIAIYVTHGHGDHCFGITTLLQRFPNAKALATPGSISLLTQQVSPAVYEAVWNTWFHGEIDIDNIISLFQPLDSDGNIRLEGHELQVVDVGQSDTHNTTFLHVPALKAVVAGDIVYNGVHQYLVESTTKELRDAWIASVEVIKALEPEVVVCAHTKPGRPHTKESLGETIRYLETFSRLVGRTDNAQDLYDAMVKEFPERFNLGFLWLGSLAQFR